MSTGKEWKLTGAGSLEVLQLFETPVPEVYAQDVLVKLKAASLNYRDIAMVLGHYPRPMDTDRVPGSDGAGEVIAVGSGVKRFAIGDRVTPCFFEDFVAGGMSLPDMMSSLGSEREGVFRQYGVFPVHGLVKIPAHLDYREASTLPCAALTAWNCLYGERRVMPGDCVLVQGTGGVSLFGLQFAVAAGATVVATTSSDEKSDLLKRLGARHVVNYKQEPAWGLATRKFTPNGGGFDIIIEVGGNNTVRESIKAIKPGGDIHLVGFLGGVGENKEASIWNARQAFCNLKSAAVGNRVQFEEMNKAIQALHLKPVVDTASFGLEQIKQAYQYVMQAKHVGKVVVDIE